MLFFGCGLKKMSKLQASVPFAHFAGMSLFTWLAVHPVGGSFQQPAAQGGLHPAHLVPGFHEGRHAFIVEFDALMGQFRFDAVNKGDDGQHQGVGRQRLDAFLTHDGLDEVLRPLATDNDILLPRLVPFLDKELDIVIAQRLDGMMGKVVFVQGRFFVANKSGGHDETIA